MCGCSNGWSSFEDLKKLENNKNIITNIICKYNIENEESKETAEDYSFQLFVFYQDSVLTLDGDDGYGNGYYGGGFYVTIKKVIKPNNFRLSYENEKLNLNIGFVLQLIRYHYENDEDEFKEYCHFLINELNKIGEDELSGYIHAQLDEVPTFSPQ